MGNKKKRNHPGVEEILARPWCYYCERDFDDQKILHSHQKAKHFKCDRCGRRLNTAGGLSVHMTQVHKETLNAVENALPNRANPDIEIFIMEGIPEDVAAAHNQRVIQQFYEADAARRQSTGNHGPGGERGEGGQKKLKIESPSDLKKRLAEHKARKAALEAGGGSNGDVSATPPIPGPPNPTMHDNHPPYESYGPPQPSFAPPIQAPYGQPHFQPGQPPPFQQPPIYAPPQSAFSPPNAGPFPTPGQQFSPPGGPPFQPPPFHGQPHFGQGPPPPNHQGPPPHINYPPQAHPSLPAQPPHMSGGFGLPPHSQNMSRSPVNGPPMHHAPPPRPGHLPAPPTMPLPANPHNDGKITAASVDELISSAAREADVAAAVAAGPKEVPASEAKSDRKPKKEKGKDRGATKLVYSDNDVSPEEKMASLSRYAFERSETSVA